LSANDNRFLSEVYARLVCEVLAGNGIEALYPSGSVPTPAVSTPSATGNSAARLMITASHNPLGLMATNLRPSMPARLHRKSARRFEARIDASPVRSGSDVQDYDPIPAHVAVIKKMVDLKAIKRAKLRNRH